MHFVLLFLDHFVKVVLLRIVILHDGLELDFQVLFASSKAFLLLQQEFLSFLADSTRCRVFRHIGQVTELSLQLVILIL